MINFRFISFYTEEICMILLAAAEFIQESNFFLAFEVFFKKQLKFLI